MRASRVGESRISETDFAADLGEFGGRRRVFSLLQQAQSVGEFRFRDGGVGIGFEEPAATDRGESDACLARGPRRVGMCAGRFVIGRNRRSGLRGTPVFDDCEPFRLDAKVLPRRERAGITIKERNFEECLGRAPGLSAGSSRVRGVFDGRAEPRAERGETGFNACHLIVQRLNTGVGGLWHGGFQRADQFMNIIPKEDRRADRLIVRVRPPREPASVGGQNREHFVACRDRAADDFCGLQRLAIRRSRGVQPFERFIPALAFGGEQEILSDPTIPVALLDPAAKPRLDLLTIRIAPLRIDAERGFLGTSADADGARQRVVELRRLDPRGEPDVCYP